MCHKICFKNTIYNLENVSFILTLRTLDTHRYKFNACFVNNFQNIVQMIDCVLKFPYFGCGVEVWR